ncbi:MAG: protein kinase domain-containing protein [Aeoliella sp.]
MVPTDPDQTDVRLASEIDTHEPTGGAPSIPPPLAHEVVKTVPYTGSKHGVRDAMTKGERIDDFEIEAVLGRGAFGVVYLARQLSLDRQVALKVAANQGSEGRTMARLEHEHIVQVFSETVDTTGKLRLLCMQLVPGAPLDALIHDLGTIRHAKGSWNGADVLASVDSRSKLSDVFDPSALHDREALAKMDDLEAASWIGARLAEAVDYAHRQGVLHRDIKPANVLVNRYGQPLLADFNISFQSAGSDATADEGFGGTLAYMSPEHLEAFHPANETSAEAVNERSDIYSLGIVLFELLYGEFPFEPPKRCDNQLLFVERMAESRSASGPEVSPGAGNAAKAFSYLVARCLDPKPDERFATGEELAEALDGCRQLRGHERATRSEGFLIRAVKSHPIRWVIIFALLPQLVGSLFNISYNLLEIVPRLSDPQKALFGKLVLGYNAIVYPAAVVAGWALFAPLYRVWKELHGKTPVAPARLEWARRRSLQLPMWLLLFAAVGWLPGGVLFPLLIDALKGSVSNGLYLHFIASFTLSGLIAVAYSLCGVQFAAMRGLYARLWPRAASFRAISRRELPPTRWRLLLMQILAGIIPSVAVVMLLATSDEANTVGFRLLTVALILLGTIGFLVMLPIAGRMARFIDSLDRTDDGR